MGSLRPFVDERRLLSPVKGAFFALLLFTCSAFCGSVARADTLTEITVVCDSRKREVLVLSGGVTDAYSGSVVYAVAKISQYVDNKKPTVVCSFSSGTVSVKGGLSEEHPRNNNVTVYVDGVNTGDRIWLVEPDSRESVKFSGRTVEIGNCAMGNCSPTQIYTKDFKPSRRSHPSFGCASAKTVVEVLICDDDALADADKKMSEAFKGIVSNFKAVERHKLWLWTRGATCGLLERSLYPVDVSPAKSCLLKVYEGEIAELKKENAN